MYLTGSSSSHNMQLVRENINFERVKDPKASMGVGDPWMIGLNHSREGIAILSTIELFGNREIVPSKAPKNKGSDNWNEGKDWEENYVRNEFPFQNDAEFKEVKDLYRERMNRPWPGSLSITRTDRFGIYKTFRFDWVLTWAYKKGMEYVTGDHKHVFGFDMRGGSYGISGNRNLLQPGDTYKKIFDYAGEIFRQAYSGIKNK